MPTSARQYRAIQTLRPGNTEQYKPCARSPQNEFRISGRTDKNNIGNTDELPISLAAISNIIKKSL
jgi:hypothetical protein